MMRALISAGSRIARKARLAGLSRASGSQPGRPLVVGFLSAPSGIGMGARLILDALDEAGLAPAAIDVTPRFQPGLALLDWRRGRTFAPDDLKGPVLVHVNAPEAPFVLSELGRKRLGNRLRIAYWAWEFERLPASWVRELGWFHECWAPSRFTAEAILAHAPDMPVRAPGYPLAPAASDPDAVADYRARFEASPGQLVLHAFDMRSSMDRKNPLGAVEIFRKAAEGAPGAGLVLKVNSWGWRPGSDQRLRDAIADDPRIHLVTDVLSDHDMAALVGAADIYLSPHRCEGFGLVMASALLAGAQVLMTDWSGNLDFANLPGAHPIACAAVPASDASGVYRFGTGQWAAPDLDEAARTLQRLFAGEAEHDAGAIRAAAADHFGTRRWLERLGPVFWSRIGGDDKAQ